MEVPVHIVKFDLEFKGGYMHVPDERQVLEIFTEERSAPLAKFLLLMSSVSFRVNRSGEGRPTVQLQGTLILPKTVDLSNGRLQELIKFANKDLLLATQLSQRLLNLQFGTLPEDEVVLYPDFDPLSLYWVWSREGQQVMNGGLIWHGPHDNGGDGGAPTFSVSLSNDTSARWEIHT